MLLLFIQRWFPKFCFEKRRRAYDFRINPKNVDLADKVCPICMENFIESQETESLTTNDDGIINNTSSATIPLTKIPHIMKTPCQHFYHESCMLEWMKKKFECPTCRKKLPPLDIDDAE
mmetsp:Transcript_35923/g.32314  ORF Transcript_35923/g.32314 Transcript_35923/m.32314 type:complete len:119 (+) Transcript_35923:1350-1706(+)